MPSLEEHVARLTRAQRASGEVRRHEITISIREEYDIVRARIVGRFICQEVGFSTVDGVKVATAISELARNIFKYAGSGSVVVRAEAGFVEVAASDEGPGIADIDAVLSPSFRSRTGMGVGLRGTRRLMDSFELSSAPGHGTRVTIQKRRN